MIERMAARGTSKVNKFWRSGLVLSGAAAVVLWLAPNAWAQLNENCIISILNRNVAVRPDGSWVLPNVPANFGQVRARATCVDNGVTTSGESGLFFLGANQTVNLPHIVLGPTTAVPTIVSLSAPSTTLNQQNRTVQLTVTGLYADNSSRNLTASSTGTTYNISNPQIATISPEGLVTAVASGTVVVQAVNEGTQGILSIQVALTGDSDGDGIPDDVEIRLGLNPNDPSDALADFDTDGLNNLEEYQAGTDLRVADTDGDGLSDGAEVKQYRTNPLLRDTDGDGVSDGLEIQAGSDPLNPNSVNYGPILSRVDVTPSSFTLIVNSLNPNAYTQLVVRATLIDNSVVDLTSRSKGTTYSSSDLNICNFGAIDGRVFAGQPGACTITVVAAGRTVLVQGQVQSFQPTPLSQIAIPGYANNVDVNGTYAYVAAGAEGLQVVNVANPSSPVIVAARDTVGNADDVRIVGNLAYVADGTNGLVIMNIATPTNPVIVGSVNTAGEAVDVWVSGNFAYIANGSAGMTIVNVTNPGAPIVVSTVSTGGIARGVVVKDNIAIVVSDNTNTLRTYNVSNPSAPIALGSVTLPASLKDVAVSGTLAAVAAFTGGTHFVDVTNPAAPVLRGTLPGGFGGLTPRDVEFGIGFAIVSDQVFPNAVGFIDFTDISNPVRRGILDFSQFGTFAGTGLATSGALVFKTGENFGISEENGVTGTTRLFIGQYLPLEDRAGVPPTVSLLPLSGGNTRIQGEHLTVSAEAFDDIAVASVNFLVNGTVVFTDTSAPYEYSLTVPSSTSSVTLLAEAFDLANNRGQSAPVTLQVIPDPLTTVTGRVLDEAGTVVSGAAVSVTGDFTTTTGNDGRFSIPGVTTVNGDIVAQATFNQSGTELRGSSVGFAPVRGGTTSVGDFRVYSARYETNIGACWSNEDDVFIQVALPFSFPFYGTGRTTVFIGTNGYVTFTEGDNTYTETIPDFNTLPRIAAFFDDLFGRTQGCTHYNILPDRLVVTYNNVQHFSAGGSNTLQMILFSDGRIQFAYRGITALTTGNIVGITPGPNSPAQAVNFNVQTAVEIPAATAVYEYFLTSNPFDLDGAFVLFTPRTGGGYSVRTILPSPGSPNIQVSGGPVDSRTVVSALDAEPEVIHLQLKAVAERNAFAATATRDYSNAEVEVTASTDVKYKGTTNTDRSGNFSIGNVPRGGINVTVKRKGAVLGNGSVVVPPFPTTQRSVTIVVDSATIPSKP
jgi:hypothetical protein